MKVGILGGTFDPIHQGHLKMAETAYKELKLDKILIMPSGNPPHKDNISSSLDRSNMIKLAIEGIDYLEYSDFELKRDNVIYTAETLQLLSEENPDKQFTFIVGADSFLSITDWYRPSRIFRYARLAVCNRNNVRERVLYTQRTGLEKAFGAIIDILHFEGVDISSQYIRNIIKKANNNPDELDKIKDFINPNVLNYIIDKGLYI